MERGGDVNGRGNCIAAHETTGTVDNPGCATTGEGYTAHENVVDFLPDTTKIVTRQGNCRICEVAMVDDVEVDVIEFDRDSSIEQCLTTSWLLNKPSLVPVPRSSLG